MKILTSAAPIFLYPKISRFSLNTFSADENLIFYCQQGLRSHQAAEFFRQAGFPNSFSLQGGLSAYKKHFWLFEQNLPQN
ncbi:MAG: rhodanese-like domain-containing protein [Janthinobacterium lividum]